MRSVSPILPTRDLDAATALNARRAQLGLPGPEGNLVRIGSPLPIPG